MTSNATYPFGRPVTARPPSSRDRRPLFVLGAYPSALHVEWTPPAPWRFVRAIAVDDEPTPFWDGDGQETLARAWEASVGFRAEWGAVRVVPRFNGPSGAWVREQVLTPLGFTAADACITDCLDTYRASVGAAGRLADTYAPFAQALGVLPARLLPHPSEDAIVAEALRLHRARLLTELDACRPETVVTLGNAALRVARELLDGALAAPQKLRVEQYGTAVDVCVASRAARLLPLAHPAAPARYQDAHARWREGR